MRILASILAALALAGPLSASQASELFRKAEKFEKSGNLVQAYLLYAQASAIEPANEAYRARTAALQPKAAKMQELSSPIVAAANTGDMLAADAAGQNPLLALDPEVDSINSLELDKARRALPPAEVHLPSGRFDFHFNGDPKELFNQIAHRCGLQTQFDSEYNLTPLKVRFDIEDVDCRNALHAAESATSSFIAPLSSKLVLISKDTPIKRTDNEQTMAAVIPVPTTLTTQDLTEIAQAVKQVTGINHLAWSNATSEIVIRDRVSRVIPAKVLIEQLTAYRGAVFIELRFLQLTDTDLLKYGVDLTNTFNVIWGANQNIANAGASLSAVIRALEHGTHVFGITALEASVVANLTHSDSRTILRTQLRAVSGLPASLHVGQKYPILTAGYFGPTASATQGTAYTPPPSFTYQDLGVSLKFLPVVCSNDLITMDIDTDYQLLAGQSIDGIPILANRSMTTRIAIRNDEWALVGGLMDRTENKSISGVAGLARIPLLGYLFRTDTREKDRDHIVILIKPHIIGEPPATHESAPMAVGTDARPLSPI